MPAQYLGGVDTSVPARSRSEALTGARVAAVDVAAPVPTSSTRAHKSMCDGTRISCGRAEISIQSSLRSSLPELTGAPAHITREDADADDVPGDEVGVGSESRSIRTTRPSIRRKPGTSSMFTPTRSGQAISATPCDAAHRAAVAPRPRVSVRETPGRRHQQTPSSQRGR
jgi:hypothetical protein